MKIIKRDGHIVDYMPEKIENAILKANAEVVESERVTDIQIKNIIKYIENLKKKRMLVEDIQDIIEMRLMSLGKYVLAKQYITYRYTRELVRKSNTTDLSIRELIDSGNERLNDGSFSNNAKTVSAQRDYIASITSTDITRRFLLPEETVKAHDEGIIHFHGANYFAQNALHNCDLINLGDMLNNGTNINGATIERPHRFLSAITITTQIITAVLESQYGGSTITLTHLAPFVRESYNYYLNKYKERKLSKDECERFAKEDLKKEIVDGVQIFLYQINSLGTINGKLPVLSIFMYLGETKEYKEELKMLIDEFLRQKINGIKKDNQYVDFESPRYIYVLEGNVDSDIIECLRCGRTMDFISEKIMKEEFKNSMGVGECFPCMRKNMFLTLNNNYYGRFNQGVVTINLVDIALSSNKYIDEFWNILDDRLELCHRTLQVRHKRLSKITASAAPILWQYGALARLDANDSIHALLHNGYSTISVGYAGLYECVNYMIGASYIDNNEAMEFALKLIDHIKEACLRWSDAEDIDYTIYGISSNAINRKFVNTLRERFGNIRGITDKDAITNYYTNNQNMNIFDRLSIEKKMQNVNFGETSSSIKLKEDECNKDVINYIYDNIMYIRINDEVDL